MSGRIKKFVFKNKKRYIKGIVALLIINLLQISIPIITGKLIDGIQFGSINISNISKYPLFIFIIAAAVFILNYFTRLQIMGASIIFQYETGKEIFRRLEKLSMSFFSRKTIGELMALSVNDVKAVRVALSRGTNLIIDTFFLMVLSIIAMSKTINMRLALIAFIPIPILIFIVAKFGLIINKKFRKVQESFSDLTEKVQENVSGIRVIKAFVQEQEEARNFKVINKKNYETNIELVKVWGIFYPLIEFISSISYLFVLVYGSSLVLKKQITIGDFIAVNSYIGVLVRPIKFIGVIVNTIQKGKASSDRIENLFDEKTEIFDEKEEELDLNNSKLRGKIEFRDLTFSYNNKFKPVLKNINLTIEPGKTTAVVGKIGSGKSTLGSLILRLYNPEQKGQLLIDGIDITEIPIEKLRHNIGYVPQDNFLFSQSIKYNIGFSEDSYDIKDIEESAHISQVYDNIMDFPNKFDTVLGERGVNVSGGQKQRISIARAIIKKPSILIFDDCLSAVDTNTEKNILDGLKEICKSSACIIISHRISSIKHADEIIVLNKGSIIERGSHAELIKIEGLYYRMYKKQISQEESEEL
ncbi:ABC transporter ATP-binding protein [Clostridium sp. PL3]|uniref:ABC transporter ATP-binding protein n=1 Tax=Clostridium thailandense TaxID=2794346 RepID=A0A949TXS4_9CLOT|nr:ABC transporter ATP-binding protein [Clostridium thailandense]MBV7273535.1 ABC transporter ATP-binding protein [Clostridium thailandense]